MNKSEIYNNLPRDIKTVLIMSEGWLVGGAVLEKDPRDYDIIVESPELFQRTTQFLTGARYIVSINSFGGLKFYNRIYEIDIWVCSLSNYITNRNKNKQHPIFNLKHNIIIYNYESM